MATAAACTFCRIAAGDLQAVIVFDDAQSLAFLDHRPVFPGHCLLIPKLHYETLSDLPQPLAASLFENARTIASAVESALQADGAFVAINNKVSQSVPHVHIHVVPRRRKDGLRGFFWPRGKYENAEMERIRSLLREAIARGRAGAT